MKKLLLTVIALSLFHPAFADKQKSNQSDNNRFSCDDPIPYCKQMKSCEQAKFYLNHCGAYRLDRDRDGVPCENICGRH